jgi:hypothetical protein
MNRKLFRTIHRTIFIFMGIFIISWLLSGLLMTIPASWFGPVADHQNPPADWSRITLSPAAAIARATTREYPPAAARNVSLRQINEHLLYSVTTTDDKEVLIDAHRGRQFEFTPALAESIIRTAFKVDAPLQEISILEQHDHSYPWGSLPAWRVSFQDAPSAEYYLAERDLRMFRSSPVTRIRAAIMSLHEFEPITLVTDNWWVRKGLLIAISAIALVGAMAGLFLTLPGNRK